MSHPRVSIVVPIYNAEPYLDECLDSIEKQTENSVEIICVNDKSTDGTMEILERRSNADSRYRIIQAEGRGAGVARNLGIEAATGTYLVCLDADDFFDPTFLEDTANKLDETDADIVITQSYTYENDTHEEYVTDWTFVTENVPDKEVFSYQDIEGTIFNTFSNVPWNKVYKRDFIIKNNLKYQDVRRTDDLLFTCVALVKAGSITTIRKPYTHYRISLTTNSTSTNEVDPLAFFEAFNALKEELVRNDLYEALKVSFVNHATDGYFANLTSQKTISGFTEVFEFAKQYYTTMDIGTLSASDYTNPSQLAYIQNAMDMSLSEFIFSQLLSVTAQRNDAWKTNRINERQKWEYRGAYNLASAQIISLENRLLDEKEKLGRAQNSLKDAECEIRSIKESKAYRLGDAIAKPYRKIVNAIRN